MAAWAGQLNCLKALLAAGAKISVGAQDDMQALHFAALKGHTACVQWLLDEGAKINCKNRRGFSPLHMAASHGHKDIVELLIKRRANPTALNKRGETALQLCKDEEIIALLGAAALKWKDQMTMKDTGPKEKKERANVRKAGTALGPTADAKVGGDKEFVAPEAKKAKVIIDYDDYEDE